MSTSASASIGSVCERIVHDNERRVEDDDEDEEEGAGPRVRGGSSA